MKNKMLIVVFFSIVSFLSRISWKISFENH